MTDYRIDGPPEARAIAREHKACETAPNGTGSRCSCDCANYWLRAKGFKPEGPVREIIRARDSASCEVCGGDAPAGGHHAQPAKRPNVLRRALAGAARAVERRSALAPKSGSTVSGPC